MLLRVAAGSDVKKVAGAVCHQIQQLKEVELLAVAAGAINQAVKSIATARGYLASANVDIVCVPEFSKVEIEGQEKTAIKFVVTKR